jgi:hypothetical protein
MRDKRANFPAGRSDRQHVAALRAGKKKPGAGKIPS